MLAHAICYALIAVLTAGSLLNIRLIGKPRKPLTHNDVTLILISNALSIVGLAYVLSVL